MRTLALIAVGIAAGLLAPAYADRTAPVIQAPTVTAAPVIDGVLDDACWADVKPYTGFIHTALGTPATQPTEVWLARDEKHLYVAFYCHDSNPELIRARQRRRNGDLGYDDRITINLDTQHTHTTPYYFKVNALGTQTESIPSGSASNITWRGDWEASAKILADGWTVEVAIPFSALRYPDNCDTFGVAFSRTLARNEENTAWPNISPNYSENLYADLIGLALPGNPARPILMPYLVTSREPGNSFDEIGLDYKQELNSNTIAMLTYNPDFSNVQDAVATIDYSYTEQYLNDQRPFFQEGSQLFPDSKVFYSRRAGDMDWGAKVFGNSGGSAFAALATAKKGEESHLASAYSYRVTQENGAAGMKLYFSRSAIEDQYRTDPNSPYSSECWSPGVYWERDDSSGSTYISARQYVATNTGRPSSSSFNFTFDRSPASGCVGGEFGYDDVDADFYVRDGYTSTTGIRGPRAKLEYYKQLDSGKLRDWSANVSASRYRAPDGSTHDESVSGRLRVSTMSEWDVSAVFKEGSWLGKRDSSRQLIVQWLDRHLYTSGELSVISGKRSGEDYRFVSLRQGFEVNQFFTLNGSWEWSSLGEGATERRRTQYTVSGSWELDSERNLSLWVVGRDSNLNLCCTYKKAARSGSDIYLIYGYPNSLTTEKRLAMKVVMPLSF